MLVSLPTPGAFKNHECKSNQFITPPELLGVVGVTLKAQLGLLGAQIPEKWTSHEIN